MYLSMCAYMNKCIINCGNEQIYNQYPVCKHLYAHLYKHIYNHLEDARLLECARHHHHHHPFRGRATRCDDVGCV